MYRWPLDRLFKSRDSLQKYIISLQLILGVYGICILPPTYAVILGSLAWYMFMLHVGHNAGLHRYFSHKSFELSETTHMIMCFLATFVAFGSPLGYSMIHKTHHRYTDLPDDPHQPSKPIRTFFFMFNTSAETVSPLYAKGLRDKWISFTHSYYILLVGVFYLTLWMISPVVALTYNIGMVFVLLGTGWVNTISHTKTFFTYRNFETKDKSRNDLFAGYILGEWHNNHHGRPTNFSQKVKWYEFDLSEYVIRAIKNG